MKNKYKRLKTKMAKVFGSMVSDPIEVELSRQDLEQGFKSERDFQILLHNVCLKAYGPHMANLLFPIESEDEHEQMGD